MVPALQPPFHRRRLLSFVGFLRFNTRAHCGTVANRNTLWYGYIASGLHGGEFNRVQF